MLGCLQPKLNECPFISISNLCCSRMCRATCNRDYLPGILVKSCFGIYSGWITRIYRKAPYFFCTIVSCIFKQMVYQSSSAEQKESMESVYLIVIRDFWQDLPVLSQINTTLTPWRQQESVLLHINKTKSKDSSSPITQWGLSRRQLTQTAVICHHLSIINRNPAACKSFTPSWIHPSIYSNLLHNDSCWHFLKDFHANQFNILS